MRYASVVIVLLVFCLVLSEYCCAARAGKPKKRHRPLTTDGTKFPVAVFEEVEDVRSGKKGAVVIDVREPAELVRDGRIPGFHNIPLKMVKDAFELEPEEFKTTYNFSKPETHDLIIFSCRSGRRALMAAEALDKLNKYTNIKVYEGSFENWLIRGGVIITDKKSV